MCELGIRETCGQRAMGRVKASVYEYKLGVRFIRQPEQAGHWGSSRGLRDSRWSAMLKRRGQGVELYLLGEGGLGWSEREALGAFPSGLR